MRKSTSMRKLVLQSIMGIIMIAFIIFIMLITFAGMMPSLNEASFRTLHNITLSRGEQVEAALRTRVNSVWEMGAKLQQNMDELLKLRKSKLKDLQGNTQMLDEYLNSAYIDLERFVFNESVTGAFVILNSGYTDGKYASLYITNINPDLRTYGKTSLAMFRGPMRLPNLRNIALEAGWSQEYDFRLSEEPNYNSGNSYLKETDFYSKPLKAFKMLPNADSKSWGYWNKADGTIRKDIPALVYSIPLVTSDKDDFGIVGFELALSYVHQLMPLNDLPFADSFYLMGQISEDNILTSSLITGAQEGQAFMNGQGDRIAIKGLDTSKGLVHQLDTKNDGLYASVAPLNAYAESSPFINEGWYLIGAAPKSEVLYSSRSIMLTLSITMIAAVLASLFGAMILSSFFSKKIEALVREVREIDIEKPLNLTATNIDEIDELSTALEKMTAEATQNAARMSTIVDLVGAQMGVFEINKQKDRVFLSDSLFQILEIPHEDGDSQFLETYQVAAYVPQFRAAITDEDPVEIFLWESVSGRERWLQVRHVTAEDHVYGVITDITETVKQNERLEYENNHDPLTTLLNRNAYRKRILKLINNKPELPGILIFMDLDNLKIMNDTYGHDVGDRYIQTTAQALQLFENSSVVIARISGDEFIVYIHGASNKNALREQAKGILDTVRNFELQLPDGSIQKIRLSAGLSFYPEDSKSLDDLVKYADFAMYEVKRSAKGGTYEFNRLSYERNNYAPDKLSVMDRFLAQDTIEFAFQPIIDVSTGKIFAYEAFMRSDMREFYSPEELIELAKKHSKLYQLEELVASSIIKTILRGKRRIGSRIVFFNSLHDQIIENEELLKDLDKIIKMGISLAMKITLQQDYDLTVLEKKMLNAKNGHMLIALSCCSLNHNKELPKLEVKPDYLKIGMGLVRDIDKDKESQSIFEEIVKEQHSIGICVVAEGIETREEMATVVRLGADYVQGFYFCPPENNPLEELPISIFDELMSVNPIKS